MNEPMSPREIDQKHTGHRDRQEIYRDGVMLDAVHREFRLLARAAVFMTAHGMRHAPICREGNVRMSHPRDFAVVATATR